MKSLLFSFCILGSSLCFAQDDFNLSKLKTPSAPAYTILGNQPNEISSPKSWSELEASVFSNLDDETGSLLLPSNFALEFTPFWLSRHKNLSFSELASPTASQSAFQNLSVSLASQQVNSDSSATNLGIGIRTIFDFGKPSTSLDIQAKKLDDIQGSIVLFNTYALQVISANSESELITKSQAIISAVSMDSNIKKMALTSFKKWVDELKTLPQLTPETITESKDAYLKKLPKEMKTQVIAANIDSLITDRYGFKIEVAMASKIGYPTNQIKDGALQKFGFWITPSYKNPKVPWLEFLVVGRFIRNEQDLTTDISSFEEQGFQTDFTDNIDFGGKLIIERSKWSLSTEMIYRSQQIEFERFESNGLRVTTTHQETDFKWNLNLSYRLSDQLLINYTYGQNFDLNTEIDGNLISSLNLAFALGTPKFSDLTSYQ